MSGEKRQDYSPIVNVVSGLGTAKDQKTYAYPIRPHYAYEDYNIYFRSSWACRRVVEALPKLMCRKWGKFTFTNKTDKYLAENLVKRHRTLKIKNRFRLAQYWANLHGRCYILIVAGDNEDYSQELNVRNHQIEDLLVLDKRKVYPDNTEGKYSVLYPEYYRLQNLNASQLILPTSTVDQRFKIHESRLLIFKGNELPDDEKILDWGNEASILEPFINVWIRFFSGNSSLSHVLENVDVFVHYIDGLFEMLWQGGEAAERKMQERLEANLLSRSAYKGYAIDKAKEELRYVPRNLSGVAPLSERQEAEIVAASGLPKSVLFGQFAAGLDASGKITGEQRYLNELVEESQGDKFDDNLYSLNTLLWQEKGAPQEPQGWGWKWEELYQETKKEAAEIFKIYSEADKNNIEIGIYTEEEARTRHEEKEFSTEIILNKNGTGERLTDTSIPFRNDDNTPVKKIIEWHGFKIGLQYLPFEKRHGKVLKAGYGHICKTKGADGMAVDVYVGVNLESDKIFVVEQLVNGNFDEEKIIIGVWNIAQAKSLYLSAMGAEFLGEIKEIKIPQLNQYQIDAVDKLVIQGEVLSDSEFGAIANFEEEDLQLTLNDWQQSAPDKYQELLNA